MLLKSIKAFIGIVSTSWCITADIGECNRQPFCRLYAVNGKQCVTTRHGSGRSKTATVLAKFGINCFKVEC